MSRPRIKVDTDLVEKLARIHCTTAEIAAVVGCSADTLERRFAAHIQKGRDAAKASIKRKQFELAMAGNVTMLIWLDKKYMGGERPSKESASAVIPGDMQGAVDIVYGDQDETAG